VRWRGRAAKRATRSSRRTSRASRGGYLVVTADTEEVLMGISLGGIVVIAGIVLMFVWSFWIGLVLALIGLIVFGGFARDKWY
jgi:hypothetical protein